MAAVRISSLMSSFEDSLLIELDSYEVLGSLLPSGVLESWDSTETSCQPGWLSDFSEELVAL